MEAEGTHKRRRRTPKAAATAAIASAEPVVPASTSTRQPTRPQRKRARPIHPTQPSALPTPPAAPQPDEKDEEEKALESFLFGGLLHADQLPFGDEDGSAEGAGGDKVSLREGDVESLFVIDKKGTAPLASDSTSTATAIGLSAAVSGNSVPVWHDPDDEQQMIDLAAQPRMRKLRASVSEQRITAADYQQRLRQTYTNLNHAASWVRAKRATAGTQDDDALWDVLRTSRSIKQRDTAALPSGHLDIQALKDANTQQPAQVRQPHTYSPGITRTLLVVAL